MPFSIDPDFVAAVGALLGNAPPPEPAPVGDVETRRVVMSHMFKAIASKKTPISNVSSQNFTTKTADGQDLPLRWYTKDDSPAPGSAVLFLHGGGMIALGLDDYDHIISSNVASTGVPVLAVDYRLAPESPSPGPVTDAYAGLAYLHEHASTLGVDPKRVVLMGESAGGGIAASLTHYIRAKAPTPTLPPVALQILIYPMLDDRNVDEHPLITPFLFWTPADNRTGWDALLSKERRGGFHVAVDEAPARMTVEDAKTLPPAYIEVGELDIFRDETIEYALKLGKAGVSTELHVLTGLPHAYDQVSPDISKVKRVLDSRITAIKSV